MKHIRPSNHSQHSHTGQQQEESSRAIDVELPGEGQCAAQVLPKKEGAVGASREHAAAKTQHTGASILVLMCYGTKHTVADRGHRPELTLS